MKPRSIKVVVFVLLIVLTGVFKSYVASFFTIIISNSMDVCGFDYYELERNLLFATKDGKADFGLGMFFYFATYLLLHFALIHFLFHESVKLKKYLMVILFSAVFGLGIITLILKASGYIDLGLITYYIFNQLVGRPLVLFLVEGGGLIYEYIDHAFDEGA